MGYRTRGMVLWLKGQRSKLKVRLVNISSVWVTTLRVSIHSFFVWNPPPSTPILSFTLADKQAVLWSQFCVP